MKSRATLPDEVRLGHALAPGDIVPRGSRKTRVIHNPGNNGTVAPHSRQDSRADFGQQDFVAPGRIGHHMMTRLVHPPDIRGRQACRHRLDTLALAGQQQPRAVRLQWFDPLGMARGMRQARKLCRQSPPLWAWLREACFHKTIPLQNVLLLAQQC
jgi:hypothetical protein